MNYAMGYHNMIHACITIAGVETKYMLRKVQVPWVFMKSEAQCARKFTYRFFDLPGSSFPNYFNRKSTFVF